MLDIYSSRELRVLTQGTELGEKLNNFPDKLEAITTRAGRHVRSLLGLSIGEQLRIASMKVDHIIGHGEWLRSISFQGKISIAEFLITDIQSCIQDIETALDMQRKLARAKKRHTSQISRTIEHSYSLYICQLASKHKLLFDFILNNNGELKNPFQNLTSQVDQLAIWGRGVLPGVLKNIRLGQIEREIFSRFETSIDY